MVRKKPLVRTRSKEQVLRKRFTVAGADAVYDPPVSAQRCALCGSDRGPFEVVFDGRRQVSVCTACSSERE